MTALAIMVACLGLMIGIENREPLGFAAAAIWFLVAAHWAGIV